METINNPEKISLAFINNSPILDIICDGLIVSGFDVLFRSENIENGLSKLSTLNALPQICVVDINFYDKQILAMLQDLRTQYPTIRLIAHSDIDDEKIGKTLSRIGFLSYLLIGSDTEDFIKAIYKS